MKKILAFAGSNSSRSINHQLVSYTSQLVTGAELELIRLTEFNLPIYSEDIEREAGFPEDLKRLLDLIKSADLLMISLNEHNGTVSAFFKNVLDWLSRIEYKFLDGKRILLMSTSPGKRGGVSALEYVEGVLPRFGAEEVTTFRLPSFGENFSRESGEITSAEHLQELRSAVNSFLQ